MVLNDSVIGGNAKAGRPLQVPAGGFQFKFKEEDKAKGLVTSLAQLTFQN